MTLASSQIYLPLITDTYTAVMKLTKGQELPYLLALVRALTEHAE